MAKKKTPLVDEVAAVIDEAVAQVEQDDAQQEPIDSDPDTSQAHAAEFLIGNLMEAAKRRFTELAVPWRELREEEQGRVLAGPAEDVRVAVGDADQKPLFDASTEGTALDTEREEAEA